MVLERGDAIARLVARALRPPAAELEPLVLAAARRPYARGTGTFPSRDEVVAYLEDYARDNALDVRLSTRVERIDADGAGWVVRTSARRRPRRRT